MRAYAKINELVRNGQLRYEALYQESYRHNFFRLGMFDSEAEAIEACISKAVGNLTVQAGRYEGRNRKMGDVLHYQ